MSFFIKRSCIDESLEQKAQQGIRLLEPLKSLSSAHGTPFNILEETQATGDAEVHLEDGDLWQVISGTPKFIVGGTLANEEHCLFADGSINKLELKGSHIIGGEEHSLAPGDVLFIPSGIPHQHRSDGTTRMVIIKIPKR